MSTFVHLLSLSGGIFALLALLLLLALAVAIERGWYYFHVLGSISHTVSAAMPGTPSRTSLTHVAETYGDMPQGLLATTALQHLDSRPDALESALEHRITEILPALDRNLWLLDAVVTLAPLFGLLGTIIGMVQTFNLLGTGPGMVSTHTTGGIADALIATGSGLFVAIIAVIALSVLNARMRETIRQLDAIKLAGVAIARELPALSSIRAGTVPRAVAADSHEPRESLS
jgi:biopolymer transport protein ExbB